MRLFVFLASFLMTFMLIRACNKPTNEKCVSDIMSKVDEQYRNSEVLNAYVSKVCRENDNDTQKSIDVILAD